MTHRVLDLNEMAIVERILSAASFTGADQLRAQIPKTLVVGGLPTLLELEVENPDETAPISDGPIPVRAVFDGRNGEVGGEVMIWVKDGCLSGLELAWYTDEAPEGFPNAEQLRTV